MKVKCDCCGKMFEAEDLIFVVVDAKEFDGLACEKCVKEELA